ncbi:hypothetical protein NQ176_g4989 [Zarea fungicola]|uniref:Uncharacterized protein n=1 Tax=Zarea fungicola TaxID=93591 RepID=A0ACC1NBI5_9HYPO|nr:hypothetical protein NQ176_g4989 [Lecanicillium fungicola]
MRAVKDYAYSSLPVALSAPETSIPSRTWSLHSLLRATAVVLAVTFAFFAGYFSRGAALICHSRTDESWFRFEGSFEFTNRFRGSPSSDIDKEWDRFTQHPLIDGTASLISVSLEDIKRANKTASVDWVNSTVQYGNANGGGYMATLEIFHQLHCLNMIRKVVHSEYYTEMAPFKNGTRPFKMATHLDHCIEILRQVISCYGDTGLITFHWVKGNPVPYPDFNTWHQCRDPEAILEWSKQREAPVTVPVRKERFEWIVEMPHAP